ncbi:toxin-antitoxin system, antitoxin component, Xre family [Prevotella sp. DNF00663]|uniref:helix-turn-helix domain-containing protein n=1 Tax=Prevotella sp. DNF00663 TaxID=1384078 RepID=UPI0007821911|nr:helix-turn-helix transcriptional regulator [Prevotella sp. DNF00663]KXB79191.1 toxin-antitoxin system, antitoxin component, Xre family [Prevotella sp. DNF00663]
MYVFEPISSDDIQRRLSECCRLRRLEKNMSQKALSDLSGVPLSTIQRFEHTGEISLGSFVKIGRALGYAQELMEVMSKPKYNSLDEMVKINKNKSRKRGTDEKG